MWLVIIGEVEGQMLMMTEGQLLMAKGQQLGKKEYQNSALVLHLPEFHHPKTEDLMQRLGNRC